MEKVKTPVYIIEYEQKDITADISPVILSLTYEDHRSSFSDDIKITVEDRKDLWKNSWFPTKGDLLKVYIGYENEKLLDCGDFTIDEIEFAGPPDTMNLKGLSTSIKESLRQKNNRAYEKKTLEQIATEIANAHGYKLIGDFDNNIRFNRITQHEESDLFFLKTLAEKYGYIFKVVGENLVFYAVSSLDQSDAVYEITKQNLIDFNLKTKTRDLYKAAEVYYQDPETKQVITFNVKAEGISKGDILKINERCENKEQAIIRGNSALNKKNRGEIEGTLTLVGNPILVGGINIDLSGFGMLDGKYMVDNSRHIINASEGYKTELEVKKNA